MCYFLCERMLCLACKPILHHPKLDLICFVTFVYSVGGIEAVSGKYIYVELGTKSVE